MYYLWHRAKTIVQKESLLGTNPQHTSIGTMCYWHCQVRKLDKIINLHFQTVCTSKIGFF